MTYKARLTSKCCGADVIRDACARWSEAAQDWELSSTQDDFFCDDCGDECHVVAHDIETGIEIAEPPYGHGHPDWLPKVEADRLWQEQRDKFQAQMRRMAEERAAERRAEENAAMLAADMGDVK